MFPADRRNSCGTVLHEVSSVIDILLLENIPFLYNGILTLRLLRAIGFPLTDSLERNIILVTFFFLSNSLFSFP